MLIGGHYPKRVFLNVCFHSRSLTLRADWRKSDSTVDGEQQGNWRLNSHPETYNCSYQFSESLLAG